MECVADGPLKNKCIRREVLRCYTDEFPGLAAKNVQVVLNGTVQAQTILENNVVFGRNHGIFPLLHDRLPYHILTASLRSRSQRYGFETAFWKNVHLADPTSRWRGTDSCALFLTPRLGRKRFPPSPYSTPPRPGEVPPDTRFAFLSDRES